MSARKKIIHVGRQTIASNKKHGRNEPPLIVREGHRTTRAHKITLLDSNGHPCATFVYSADKPLSCGARCWLETSMEVVTEVFEQG